MKTENQEAITGLIFIEHPNTNIQKIIPGFDI